MGNDERKLILYTKGKKVREVEIEDRSVNKPQYALEDFTEEEIAYLKEELKDVIEAYRKAPLVDFKLLARLCS